MKISKKFKLFLNNNIILIVLFSIFCLFGCNQATINSETISSVSENDSISVNQSIDGSCEAEHTEEVFVPQDTSVSLVMVGDMLMHMGVVKSGYLEDGSRNYDHLFQNVEDLIKDADIAIVNQETILGGEDLNFTGYPRFNSPFEVGDAIVNAGFNVVLHATNHALDKDKQGILNCLSYWETNHPEIAVLGIQDKKQSQENIFVFEKNDIKIAILNYTYGTNGLPLPEDMPYCVNLLDKERVKNDLLKAKEIADFIVVCPHWGTEYSHSVSSYQKDWAQFFLDNDVDLVIGSHPHVIEPVELFEREDGHKMLVYYSLGNFVNATNSYKSNIADRMVGAMAKVKITKNGTTKETYISEYGIEPLINHYQYGVGYMSCYKLSDYTDELVQKSETINRDSRFSVSFSYDLCNEVFGEELMSKMITVEY